MKQLHALFIISLLVFTACDDGPVYPKETEQETGRKAILTAHFENIEAWPEAYLMIFAGFGESTKTPVISKIISKPDNADDIVEITINGLPDEVTTLSVSVVSKGHALIHHFGTYPVTEGTEDITLPETTYNVAEYPRIQHQLFNLYCTSCHGAGNYAAAGLHLTEDVSYQAIVNIPATLSSEGHFLINPGNASRSFLHEILVSDIIRYNHTDVLPEEELITLLDTWIEAGAKNE